MDYNINNITPDQEPICKPNNSDFELSFKITDFFSDKHEKQFINSTKRLIRGSYEYKEWVNFLISVKQLTTCIVTGEKLEECKIEFHHHPISLQNIVTAIIDKKIANKQSFSTLDIATEAMHLHYNMKIGVVPLVTTMHQKFHNGFLRIGINNVIGDYEWFINNYPLREEAMKTVLKYVKIAKSSQIGWGGNQ